MRVVLIDIQYPQAPSRNALLPLRADGHPYSSCTLKRPPNQFHGREASSRFNGRSRLTILIRKLQTQEETVMKKIVSATLVVCAFFWISIVSADNRRDKPFKHSPESFVTCGQAGGPSNIQQISVLKTIGLEQCPVFSLPCAPCILSLEDQGCKIVEVVVAHSNELSTQVTYLLSCFKP